MSIVVGTVSHETNTFTNKRTGIEEFTTVSGEDIFEEFGGGRSLDGIVDTLCEDYELVPTVAVSSISSGLVEPEVFEWVHDAILSRIEPIVDDLDGICLDLHGSMFVEGEPDAEGALLAAVREAVGNDVPIVAALDMHATLSEDIIKNTDALVGYRTAPHTDVYETGVRAAEVLKSALEGGVDLAMERIKLPILIAGEQSETEAQPMRDLMSLLEQTETRNGHWSTSYFLGFPWADNPHAGVSAIAVGEAENGNSLRATAIELAETFWDRREEFGFSTEARPLQDALDIASETPSTPVVIGDSGDIPGAGASQDVMNTLEAMAAHDGLGRASFSIVIDPSAVKACFKAGEGETLSLEIGRLLPRNEPYTAEATVKTLHLTEDFRGKVRTVHVIVDGIDLILAERKTNLHRQVSFLKEFGLGPENADTIVLKSGYLSPDWKEAANYRMLALTGGDTNQRLAEKEFDDVPRPIYPLDDVEWVPPI